jgi:hypothetical protein
MAGYYEKEYATKGSVLAHPTGYSAYPQTVAATDAAVSTEGGAKVLLGGTIYPANDATAKGVVLQDYAFSDGDATVQAAIVYVGDIKAGALKAPLAAEAKAALPGIHVFGE